MPWGMNVATNRGFGVAAVCARSVAAGTIASSSGKARVTPAPRRKVRRGMCFFAMNMFPLGTTYYFLRPNSNSQRSLFLRALDVVLKRRAPHDAQHERGKPVVARSRVAHDRSHQRHVLIFHSTTQGVGEQLFHDDARELLRVLHQEISQARDTVDLRSVRQHSAGVDRLAFVLDPPRADP